MAFVFMRNSFSLCPSSFVRLFRRRARPLEPRRAGRETHLAAALLALCWRKRDRLWARPPQNATQPAAPGAPGPKVPEGRPAAETPVRIDGRRQRAAAGRRPNDRAITITWFAGPMTLALARSTCHISFDPSEQQSPISREDQVAMCRTSYVGIGGKVSLGCMTRRHHTALDTPTRSPAQPAVAGEARALYVT